LRQADDIVLTIAQQNKVLKEIWQFPIVLLPYGQQINSESIVLRPIQSQEAMNVNFYPMPRPVLTQIRRALSALPQIDYIFYDITNKPPATIEWE
jgi:GMP synthase (glutamine-hydrolysing)